MADDVVNFRHGSTIWDTIPEELRWPGHFPDKAGHNDIIETDINAYFSRLASFFEFIKFRRPGESVPPCKPPQIEMIGHSNSQDGRYRHLRAEDEGQEVMSGGVESVPSCKPPQIEVIGHSNMS